MTGWRPLVELTSRQPVHRLAGRPHDYERKTGLAERTEIDRRGRSVSANALRPLTVARQQTDEPRARIHVQHVFSDDLRDRLDTRNETLVMDFPH